MRKAGIIIAAVLVVLCGGVGVLGYQAYAFGKTFINAGITREQFDAQRKGAPEAEVRAALPDPLTGLTDEEIYGDDAGRQDMPAGASCAYYSFKPFTEEGPDLWRLCFVGGTLAAKSSLTIPE